MTKRMYRRRRQTSQVIFNPQRLAVLLGVVLLFAGCLTLWAYFSTAQSAFILRWLALLRQSLGWAAYLVPVIFVGIGSMLMQQASHHPWRWPWTELTGMFVVLVAALALTNLLTDGPLLSCTASNGGVLGCLLASGASYLVGRVGAIILYLVAALAGLLLLFHIPFKNVAYVLGIIIVWLASIFQRLGFAISNIWHKLVSRPGNPPTVLKPQAPFEAGAVSEPEIQTPVVERAEPVRQPLPAETRPARREDLESSMSVESAEVNRAWQLPDPRDILVVRQDSQMNLGDIRAKARIIEQTLQSLGVPAKVVEVNPGPVVTQFGIEPGYVERYDRDGEVQLVKVKVSRIAALSNDLALALAASPIRIEAPVPGKGIVGLEVPNGQLATVGLRGVIESSEFITLSSRLAIALGRDVSGTAVVADLLKLPHMLVAGATNSGKSVCLNAIITCLLLHNTPDELKLILVDPKRVELSQYSGIPHLLAPVIVEPDRVMGVLNWLTREMDRRYRTFSAAGARNIEVYNEICEQHAEPRMPYIVLVMDELADLMLVSPDEVERAICRLAQMARATGIHLVLATQRPSVDVVTGLIKANFPARIAFAVTSQIDSRVILDTPGAEKLLGRGDALLMMPNSPQLIRVQGCFVSESELGRLVQFWRAQIIQTPQVVHSTEEPGTIVQPSLWQDNASSESAADAVILAKAREVIRKSGKASVSLLQRNLGIGYTRAARLIDELEQEGFIGPATGTSKPREIIEHEKDEENKNKDEKKVE